MDSVNDRPSRFDATDVDVLFGQAYFLRFDPKLWAAHQPYAPLGTLYAAANLRHHGYRVALFDSMLATSEAEWAAALDRHRPRFAVIYEDSFNYLTKMCLLRMRQAALTMIGAARERRIPTIVAGSDATDHADLYLERGTDVVLAGEAEVTLRELLDKWSVDRGCEIDAIPGLCLRAPNGTVRRTRPREVIRDLDGLPMPAWDLIDVDRYRQIWRGVHGYFSMNLVTTRGCPYHCNWCAKPIYGQRYTARSAEHVVEEMRWLKLQYAPDHLWIADDIFGLKPGWIERFAALVRERHALIPFKCLVRADQVTSSVTSALASAGCQIAWIGAESGSQRILDAMEKGIHVEQIVTAARRLHESGIAVGMFLQFGYPGEAWEDIERTRQMVRDCRPDDIGISISYPLPGTPFFERVRSDLGAKTNWFDSDDLAMMYTATYDPPFYRVLHALVHAEFKASSSSRRSGQSAGHTISWRRHRIRQRLASAVHAAKVPLLEWRLRWLARHSRPTTHPLTPALGPGAAAVPTDQSSLS